MGGLMAKRSCWVHVCFAPLLIMLLELDCPARAQEAGVPYEVKIEGVDNDALRETLRAAFGARGAEKSAAGFGLCASASGRA